jgi:hypothetical protein
MDRLIIRKKTVFNACFNFENIGPINVALGFYKFQLLSHRKAVDAWTLVGRRNGVVKDIRVLIAKMIWKARDNFIYESECEIEIEHI